MNWTAPDDASSVPAVTQYTVTAYPTGGSAAVDPVTVAGSATTATFSGLAAGSTYQFAVKATNVNGTGPESAKSGTVTVQGAVVANAGPDQSVTRRTTAQTVQLTSAGSSTAAGTTYQWTRTGGQVVTLSSATSPNPTFTLPVYTAGTSNAPITFRLTVTNASGSATDDVSIELVTDRVTIGTARWKANDFRVTGSDTSIGNTVGIYVANANGTPGALVAGATGTTTAAAPPAIGGTYDIRVRTGVPNPVRVVAVSNLGGVSAPFTVTT